ncbi:hypothetical protein [Acidithiobacillus thiooxidans]|uniref:hypothetical protein n=1 Tax=Acidithiobacillus thiooxidans TaxID=930 RepID=UPI001C078B7B|nr:hypothetical protein [Acidithiobacillus thiooxidans]MBU2843550.1 hypothetical protein [Acidithiobacillus thiooxidans]
MTRLDEMANSVNVARGVAAVILENFQKIALARKRMWTWTQITAAIVDEYPDIHFTESAVQSAFKRIERGIQHKRIKPLGKPSLDVKRDNGTVASKRPAQTLEIPKKQDVLTGKEVINQSSNFKML